MDDKNTEKKIDLNCARLLIEVYVDSPLSDKVFFKNEKGALVEQRIQYDWNLCYANIFKSMITLRKNIGGRNSQILQSSTMKYQ